MYSIKVFDRNSQKKINEISNLIDKPEYLVFSPKYNILAAKVTSDRLPISVSAHNGNIGQAHETCPSMPDTLNIWSLGAQADSFLR